MNLAAAITLDNSRFNQPMASSQAVLGTFSRALTSLAAPMVAIAAGFLGAASAVGALGKASSEAANIENLETSFVTLLGSVDAARNRIAELEQFAASTPFQIPGIANASRTLETLTKGALSTGAGLTLVGDLAAATNQPFEELAVHVGRLYDGLQSGRAVGESLARLQELGIISGDVRGEIEALQKEGAKGDAVWSVAAAAFGRFGGEMDRRSQTFSGLMSTFKDNVDATFRAFGQPVNDALKPFLEDGIKLASSLKESAMAAGQNVANVISQAHNAFASGNLGEVVGLSLEIGFKQALNHLIGGIHTGVELLGRGMATVFSGDFATALGSLLTGFSSDLSAAMLEAFQTPLAALQAGIEFAVQKSLELLSNPNLGLYKVLGIEPGYKATSFDKLLAQHTESGVSLFGQNAEGFREQAKEFYAQSGQQFNKLIPELKASFDLAMEGFKASDLFKTGAAIEKLGDLMITTKEALNQGLYQTGNIGSGASSANIGETAGGSIMKAATDRFTQIGAFIGGGGGPVADYARRTAQNTDSTYKAIRDLTKAVNNQKFPNTSWS